MNKQTIQLSIATLLARAARKMAPQQVRVSLRPFFNDVKLLNNHTASLPLAEKLLKSGKPIRLELGGGDFGKPGYVNVDLGAQDGLRFDLRKPLPFPDGSVDCIYCEHIFEHFRHPDQLLHVLSECFRVLKTGGQLRAGVPDAGRAFRAYAQGVDAFYLQRYWSNIQPDRQKCPMDELNWLIYMNDEHYHMFDERSFRFRLQEAGFQQVQLDAYNPERDLPQRGHQTIYVEATKTDEHKATDEQINLAQIHEIVHELAQSDSLKPELAAYSKPVQYAVSRLMMLIAGRYGKTLAIGQYCQPLVRILHQCVVPRQEQITMVTEDTCNQDLLQAAGRDYQYVAAIVDNEQLQKANAILSQIADKLDGENYSWAYVVYLNTTQPPQAPDCLQPVHSERLPDNSGWLMIYRKTEIARLAA